MTTLSLFPRLFHLIDCSSIVAFSGADYAKPNMYIDYRDKIWAHIESMIDGDKLKTVPQLWEELRFVDESSYIRLRGRRVKFTVELDSNTDPMIIKLLFKYPDLLSHKAGYTREPCDPYLIVYAQQWKTPIICDEKSISERIGKNAKKRLSVPDVCSKENLVCVKLVQYLKEQKIIPLDYHP